MNIISFLKSKYEDLKFRFIKHNLNQFSWKLVDAMVVDYRKALTKGIEPIEFVVKSDLYSKDFEELYNERAVLQNKLNEIIKVEGEAGACGCIGDCFCSVRNPNLKPLDDQVHEYNKVILQKRHEETVSKYKAAQDRVRTGQIKQGSFARSK